MNFSSHQRKLAEAIVTALTKNSSNLINDFKLILSSAKKLYRTERFDFWLSEIGKHPHSEIPITNYGHSIAVFNSKRLNESDRNTFPALITSICENLFTYSNNQEMCLMQSDFHYYFSFETNDTFKESEMGILEGLDKNQRNKSYRIALKSELSAAKSEFYL